MKIGSCISLELQPKSEVKPNLFYTNVDVTNLQDNRGWEVRCAYIILFNE